MFTAGAMAPLRYRRLKRHELSLLTTLELEPDQVARFLGPVADILRAVERGPAHSAVVIEATGKLAGFFVLHPDLRDGACWWLGWIALDRRQQGSGYGRQALAAALQQMRRIGGCRRVRLLVSPENGPALHLYRQAGFVQTGVWAATDELVLDLELTPGVDENQLEMINVLAEAARARRVFRHRRLRLTAGPHPAWVIGVERGPPDWFSGGRNRTTPAIRVPASTAYRDASRRAGRARPARPQPRPAARRWHPPALPLSRQAG